MLKHKILKENSTFNIKKYSNSSKSTDYQFTHPIHDIALKHPNKLSSEGDNELTTSITTPITTPIRTFPEKHFNRVTKHRSQSTYAHAASSLSKLLTFVKEKQNFSRKTSSQTTKMTTFPPPEQLRVLKCMFVEI